jgi:hypothetical protein
MEPTLNIQCSYCGKYEWPEGWKDKKPSNAIEGINGNISHGVCSDCMKRELNKINEI